jgi:3-hydroxy-3-methylglutaryl CoA synthase
MASIRGYGSYVPLYRIERANIAEQHGDRAGDGETAVRAHDENVVTMGTNAAKNALSHVGMDGSDLDIVYAATTSDRFDERGVAAHVGHAVGATGRVRTGDFQGSARAATDALLAGRDAVESGRADAVLVVAADGLSAEPGTDAERTAGAGAGAVVLGAGDGVADLAATSSNTTGFVGRFKRTGESPVTGDARFNRTNYLDAVAGAVEALGDAAPDRAAFPAPDGDWGGRAARTLESDVTRHGTFDEVGYAGAGGVLLDAAATLDAARDGETALVVSYGPGGSDAVLFDVIETRRPEMTVDDYIDSKEYVPYGKYRAYCKRAGGES